MTGFDAPEGEVQAIRDWFAAFGRHVDAVDFAAGRALFAEDAMGFGTFTDVIEGRENLEREQWRAVWPTIEDFRFDLDSLRAGVSGDRRLAFAVLTFSSTGLDAQGGRFPRPGRVTVLFGRESPGDPWSAVHSHISLHRGVPQQSHGDKPEAGS